MPLTAALVGLCSLGQANPAGAGTPAAVPVSGPVSDFAGCNAVTPPPGATLYPNTEAEPSVASDGGGNLVAAWQQDEYSTRSARGAESAYSTDNGQHWSEVDLPFTGCAANPLHEPSTGRPFDASYDNWVSHGPDGRFYTTALAGNSSTYSNAVVAAVSIDKGASWQNARVIIDSIQNARGQYKVFNDKASVTADPARPGTAYVVWDQLQSPHTFPLYSSVFRGPAMFAETTDGGASWSTPRAIFDPGEKNQTLGNQVVVVNGVLYDFFDLLSSTGTTAKGGGTSIVSHVAFISSADGGAHWSPAHVVGDLDTVGVPSTATGVPVTTGDVVSVSPVFDPATGGLDVVWQDSRYSGGQYDEVVMASSRDGGRTWTSPQLVDQGGAAAFDPAIAVGGDGTVAVTYYRLESPPAGGSTVPADYWARQLSPAGTWTSPSAVGGGPFNLAAAPVVEGGYFLGDYQGLAGGTGGFNAVFVATNCADSSCVDGADPTGVYSATVPLASAP
ncbi:MAG TPA: sialidase family protein [Acidimicrobiales bacterium]|nr:sialidase family protein [Acidimicrobiales bacterium]